MLLRRRLYPEGIVMYARQNTELVGAMTALLKTVKRYVAHMSRLT